MQTIYGYDGDGFYTGETREIEDADPLVKGWTRTPVPEHDAESGEVAIWQVGAWSVLEKRPLPPEPAAPMTCKRRQGRLALLEAGYLDTVEAALEAIEDPAAKRRAMIEYEADTWDRSNPFLREMWAAVSGSEDGLDDIFRIASTK